MKSKFVKVAFIAVIVMMGTINVFNAQKSEMLSDIALANVEALADDEGGSWIIECGFHGCIIDFSWDCFYPEGVLFGYCPNMRGA